MHVKFILSQSIASASSLEQQSLKVVKDEITIPDVAHGLISIVLSTDRKEEAKLAFLPQPTRLLAKIFTKL